jgi:predicted RNA-binding protein YlqC (UPF0109 family)
MSASIDEQFIEYVVKTIVGNPDAVSIKRTIDEKGVLLELTVDPEDLGRVIGKRGAGAQALRTLLRALGTKNDARYNLKIVDVGGERPPRPEREDRPAPAEESADDRPKEQAAEEPTVAAEEGNVAEEEVAVAEEEPHVPAAARALADDDDEETHDEGSSNLDKTRRELADLDDLDI